MQQRKTYSGPDRRIHRVFVTRNTEYHVRRDVCVAVKQRQQGTWIDEHGAVSMRLEGHVKQGTLLPIPGPPGLGFRMYFADGDSDVLTSPVIAIVRPLKKVVDEYPSES